MSGIQTGLLDEALEDTLTQSLLDARPWMRKKRFTLIRNLGQLRELVNLWLSKEIPIALDTETTGLNLSPSPTDPTRSIDRIVGVCLSADDHEGYYVPVRHIATEYNLPPDYVFTELKRLLGTCRLIMHNFKFDAEVLRYEGLIIENPDWYEDTLILGYVVDASRKNKGLKPLSASILNQEMIEISDLMGNKGHICFDLVHPEMAVYYGGSDAINTYGLYNVFSKQLAEMDPNKNNGLHIIYQMEKRCMIVTLEMERNKVLIDVEYFKSLYDRVDSELAVIEDRIFTSVGRSIQLSTKNKAGDVVNLMFDNVGSNRQLGILLFGKKEVGGLGIKYPDDEEYSADGSFKTGEEVLEKVKSQSPLIPLILEHRGLIKTRGTYLDNFVRNHDHNNEVKFKLNPVAADTGRFSASGGDGIHIDGYSGVNCQNIPSNYDPGAIDLRKGLIARPGYKLCAIDYSGEELRIATNLSGEPKWRDEFLFGTGDLHTISAKVIYGKGPNDSITKIERGAGKALPDTSAVLTADKGWQRMDQLDIGDWVRTPGWGKAKIKGIYPQGLCDTYEVKTKDESVTQANADHLWKVLGQDELKTTLELKHGDRLPAQALIVHPNPIKDPKDAWLAGLAFAYKGYDKHPNEGYVILPRIPERPWVEQVSNERGCVKGKAELSKFEHSLRLPKPYISKENINRGFPTDIYRASLESRIEFIRGIADAYGSLDPKNQGEISIELDDRNSIYVLNRLLNSVGAGVTCLDQPPGEINSKTYPPFYRFRFRVWFKSTFNPFRHHPDAAKWVAPEEVYRTVSRVKNLEIKKPMRCIALDNQEGLFITREMIVTHNTMNFLVLYGGGASRLAVQAGIPMDVARVGVENFFKELKGLSKWLAQSRVDARKRGYCVTAFGRRRPLAEMYATGDKKLMAAADRLANNAPIQGCKIYYSHVLTNSGLRYIGDLYKTKRKGDGLRVWTGLQWSDFDVLDRGEWEVGEIELSNGLVDDTCDTRHEVKCADDNGFYFEKFENLTKGQRVCVSVPKGHRIGVEPAQSTFTDRKRTIEVNDWVGMAWIAGLFVGDGCYRANGKVITFSFGAAKVEALLPELRRILFSFGCDNPLNARLNSGSVGEAYVIDIQNKAVIDIFDYIGFKEEATARTKRVPDSVSTWTYEMRLAFLKGYWETDGCKKFENRYGFHTPNGAPLLDVQRLAWNLGLAATRKYYPNSDTYRLEWNDLSLFERLMGIEQREWKSRGASPMRLPKFQHKQFLEVLEPKFGEMDIRDKALMFKLRTMQNVTVHSAIRLVSQFDLPMPEVYHYYDVKETRAKGYKENTYTLHVHDHSHQYDSECIISKNTGADILKVALWRVWDYKRRNNLHDVFRILMPIHDEVVYEIRADRLHEMVPIISELMKMDDILKEKLGWKVGLEVDAEYGDTFHVDRNFFKEVAVDDMLHAAGEYTWPFNTIESYKGKDGAVGWKPFSKAFEVEDEYLEELKAGERPFQK